MLRHLAIVASLAASVVSPPGVMGACDPSSTLAAAIAVAGREASHLGYKTELMDTIADEPNSAWNIYLESFPEGFDPLPPELAERLRGKRIWVILFQRRNEPGFLIVGGGLSVFVDRCTGDVIGSLPSA